jgi:hypothetical protein
MTERLNAKKEHKIGMAHVGYAYDFCVEMKDRALAEQVFRDLMQRCQQLSKEFGFSLDSTSSERRAHHKRPHLTATKEQRTFS